MIEILTAGVGLIVVSIVVSIALVVGIEIVFNSINGDLD